MFSNTKFKNNLLNLVADNLSDIPGVNKGNFDIILQMLEACVDEADKSTSYELNLQERCGPALWGTIHWIAAVADEEKKPKLYTDLINILKEAHPCKEVCRPHMAKNLTLLKPTWYNSSFEHSVDLHNIVNKQLNKNQYQFDDAKKWYNLKCDSCSLGKSTNSNNTH